MSEDKWYNRGGILQWGEGWRKLEVEIREKEKEKTAGERGEKTLEKFNLCMLSPNATIHFCYALTIITVITIIFASFYCNSQAAG